ncbi:MAG: hypothetical protein IJY58_02185 [Alphaproteobacteria bacterium]|nr:hypothetical protein [Alphaproteobacteria bacterium]
MTGSALEESLKSLSPEARKELAQLRSAPASKQTVQQITSYNLTKQEAIQVLEDEKTVNEAIQAGESFEKATEGMTDEEKNIIGARQFYNECDKNGLKAMLKAWCGGYGPALQTQTLASMAADMVGNSMPGLMGAILTFAGKTGLTDGALSRYFTGAEEADKAAENLKKTAEGPETTETQKEACSSVAHTLGQHSHSSQQAPVLPSQNGRA